MQTFDYQASSKSQRIVRRLRQIGIWLLVLVMATAAGIALYVGLILYDIHRKAAAFDVRTSETKLMGKTPQQIITLLGQPYLVDDPLYGGGVDRVIVYEDPTGEICRIEITKGVATRVEHYMK